METEKSGQTKKCPYCSEKIQSDAIRCEFCESNLLMPKDSAKKEKDGQKKEWYKKWWGIIIILILVPFLLAMWPITILAVSSWYIWKKTSWNKQTRWIATIIVVIFSIGMMSTMGSKATPQESTKQSVATPQASQAATETAAPDNATNQNNTDTNTVADAAQQKSDADAQATQAKIDAQNKADADAKAAADAAKQKVLDDAKAAADDAQTEKDFKASCKTIAYQAIEKDPSSYFGTNVHFRGKIDQAGVANGSDWFRISVTSLGYGIYSDTVWVDSDKTNFVEGDIVNFWGSVDGPYCYTSQANFNICIPEVDANYISK